jgi:hypothetical protein
MNKSELLNWLHDEYQHWEALLGEIGTARMDQPGVNGDWSMKDMIAHLTVWNQKLVAQIQAAQGNEPDPPPPWPAHLVDEDDINAWIFQANRDRPVRQVLDESHQVFQQLFAVIESLPGDVVIEPDWHLVWVNDQRFPAGEFFDHFHDDHEADVRAWLRA